MNLADIITQELFYILLFGGFLVIVLISSIPRFFVVDEKVPKWRMVCIAIATVCLGLAIDAQVEDNWDRFEAQHGGALSITHVESVVPEGTGKRIQSWGIADGEGLFADSSELLTDEYWTIPIESITCSSCLDSKKYPVENMIDFNDQTCWQEGVKGFGEGETIEIYIEEGSPLELLRIRGGRVKSEKSYYENGRPKKLTFYDPKLDNEVVILLEDIFEDQVFDMSDVGMSRHFIITINEVYEGSSFEDTVISEMTFYGSNN